MLKAKIVNLHIGKSLDGLVEALSNYSYSSEQEKGFELFEYDKSSLKAKFVKKVIYRELVVDPYGEESEAETVRFEECVFSIFVHDDCFILVAYNPPRTLKSLISSFSDAVQVGVYVRTVEIDISNFLAALGDAAELEIDSIDRLQAKKIVVNDSSRADVVFTSAKNAFEDAVSFLKNKDFFIGKVRVQLHVGYRRGRMEVASSASFGCSEKIFDDVLRFFLSYLRAQH